ncbi:MAG: hypothetical protein AAF961_17680, partial [Planctomycetota bacterium]
RQFLAQMPVVLQSPSGPAPPGKTRYLAFAGDSTLFPNGQSVRLRDVLDGTSNTLTFVRSAPAAAVEWMKPADLDFDVERPFAGLESPQGYFLATFCDGSVRRISLAIDEAEMRALVTRDNGEPIDRRALDAPPAQPADLDLVPIDAVDAYDAVEEAN